MLGKNLGNKHRSKTVAGPSLTPKPKTSSIPRHATCGSRENAEGRDIPFPQDVTGLPRTVCSDLQTYQYAIDMQPYMFELLSQCKCHFSCLRIGV